MAKQILDDLADMFPDVLKVQRYTTSSDEGEESYEPTVREYKAKFSGTTRVVEGTTKHTLKATVATIEPLRNEDKYILPDRYEPKEVFGGVEVKPVSDENGPHHTVVYF